MTAADQAHWAGYWAHWAVDTFHPDLSSLYVPSDPSPAWWQGWTSYAREARGEENDR